MARERPAVLCFSGHDPCGGAGIQADIEAIFALGGHALSVLTSHTVQDTRNASRVVSSEPSLFRQQTEALLADCGVRAIKIGLIGEVGQVDLIAETIRRLGVPAVLDPVLRAGGGAELATQELAQAMKARLFPVVEIVTPNAAEARLLAEADDLETCGRELVESGARNVLVTGGDEPGEEVVNSWHRSAAAPERFRWKRLPQGFHGAGCTLASAVAVLLARGLPMAEALQRAQAYVHESLQRAVRIGKGRPIPGRAP